MIDLDCLPSSEQGQVEQVAQGCVQQSFFYIFQDGCFTDCVGKHPRIKQQQNSNKKAANTLPSPALIKKKSPSQTFTSVCTCCFLLFCWGLLRTVWLCLCFLPSGIYTFGKILPWAFSAQGCVSPGLTASPHMTDISAPQSPLCPFAGLPVHFSWPGGPSTGHSTPDLSHQYWAAEKTLHSQPTGNAVPDTAPGAAGLCWKDCLRVHLVLQDPQGLSCKADFQMVVCSLYWGLGLFLPKGRISWWVCLFAGFCLYVF